MEGRQHAVACFYCAIIDYRVYIFDKQEDEFPYLLSDYTDVPRVRIAICGKEYLRAAQSKAKIQFIITLNEFTLNAEKWFAKKEHRRMLILYVLLYRAKIKDRAILLKIMDYLFVYLFYCSFFI
jgi:hypothetical protein